jgi:hypothetical protein
MGISVRHFSVRHLLLLTAVVSVVLLIAVKWLPVFLVACFWILYVAGIAGALYVTSAERPKAAIVAWLIMGASLVALAVFNLNRMQSRAPGTATPAERWMTAVTCLLIGIVGLVGFYRAWRAIGRARTRRATAGGEERRAQPARVR